MREADKLLLLGEIVTEVQSLPAEDAYRVVGIAQGMNIKHNMLTQEQGAQAKSKRKSPVNSGNCDKA